MLMYTMNDEVIIGNEIFIARLLREIIQRLFATIICNDSRKRGLPFLFFFVRITFKLFQALSSMFTFKLLTKSGTCILQCLL